MYWTDWASESIQAVNKFTGKNKIIALELHSPMDIHIYHRSVQPKGELTPVSILFCNIGSGDDIAVQLLNQAPVLRLLQRVAFGWESCLTCHGRKDDLLLTRSWCTGFAFLQNVWKIPPLSDVRLG